MKTKTIICRIIAVIVLSLNIFYAKEIISYAASLGAHWSLVILFYYPLILVLCANTFIIEEKSEKPEEQE